MPSIGLLLNEANARDQRAAVTGLDFVLLERTLFDPPRAAAAKRWREQIERVFPGAELIPYVWHLISHAPEDGLRARTTRTLTGVPHAFGHLQNTPEVQQAWAA